MREVAQPPEKALGRSGPGNVGVGGVVIHEGLQVSLCAAEAHSDAVLPGPVAASGQAADLLLLDVRAGWKNKGVEKKEREEEEFSATPPPPPTPGRQSVFLPEESLTLGKAPLRSGR